MNKFQVWAVTQIGATKAKVKALGSEISDIA